VLKKTIPVWPTRDLAVDESDLAETRRALVDHTRSFICNSASVPW